ncbi:MAG: transposase [Cyanobacteria bacterium P01_F01_bin.116]
MKRRKFTAKFKVKVVLESLKEAQSLNELAQKYELAPTQISKWKRDFIANAEQVFTRPIVSKKSEAEQERDRLLRTIGEQKVALDFLKKALK